MASGTTPKVRLVRCPKCRLVLPEVADVPVYKCGGCDAILVAKNQKAIAKSMSVLQETEAAQGNKLVHVSEHGESSSSTLQEVPSSTPECHLSQESGGDQNISRDSHSEKHGENLSIEGQHNDHYDKDQNTSSDSESGGNQNISRDSHSEKHGENLSIEGQHNDHYDKDQNTSSDSESGGNQNISGDSHSEKHGENLSIEGQHNDHYDKDQNTSSDSESGGNQNISGDSHSEKHGENLSIEGQHNDHYDKDQNTSCDSESGGNQNISRDSLSEKHGENLSIKGQHNCHYDKDQNTSSDSESGGNQNISRDSHSENHGENLSIEGQHNDHYDKDQNTSCDSESGGNQNISRDSHSEKHGENLSFEGQHNDHYDEDQNTSGDSDSDHDKLDVNRSNDGQQNGSEQLQLEHLEYCDVQQPGVSMESSFSTELHRENEELMLLAEANLEAETNDKTSQLEGVNSELETNDKSDSNIRGLSIDNPLATKEINLTVTACAAAGAVISSDNLEQPQKSEDRGFNRIRSSDTFESGDFFSPSSELSGHLEYLSKSTTTRSSHAYDGSISSYDGMDDHFTDQQINSFKNNYKAANYLVPEDSRRRDKLPAKGMMNGNYGMQDHARNFSSDLSNKRHYATEKYRKWRRDELLEPEMHHHPPRNWQRLERDESPSQIPFSQRASLRGYESAGPSRQLHDESPFDSAFYPLEKAEYTEQENMKLLRMVYELQDQISKTCHLNGKPNGRTSTNVPWRQKHIPTYYYQEPPEEENFYSRYHGRHGPRSSWSQQSRFSPIPFSGGEINTRHHIDNSCLCCHPQDWHCSEQLPPPIFQHNQGFWRAHPGQSCYNSYSSCPSSPQRYLESDFSIWSHETKSDNQRYKDHELKRYLREKHHSARRHLRPMAGGAPFVTCYHCFRPLQLPADFLLFKSRFHQLRCGACSKVLKFSLQKGMHIVPYDLVAAEPPPSETEDCGDVIDVRISTSASCSCSPDGGPVSHAQFHDLQGDPHVRNMSFSSSKPLEQKKDFALEQSQNKHKNSVENFDSAMSSSNMSRSEKVSSGIEELPPRTGGSPLHQLMGYASPSLIINGFGPSISGKSSGLNS
ncbi:hypothetical protein POUND7_008673 [Theobroma cacao]